MRRRAQTLATDAAGRGERVTTGNRFNRLEYRCEEGREDFGLVSILATEYTETTDHRPSPGTLVSPNPTLRGQQTILGHELGEGRGNSGTPRKVWILGLAERMFILNWHSTGGDLCQLRRDCPRNSTIPLARS